MPPPPPELLEEMDEEILLRFPPDDPACLFRAALVCKRWCRLISGRRFRRRFREFHGAPPLLGAVYYQEEGSRFWAASSFRPPYAADCHSYWVIDARHGHILYYLFDLVVQNSITGQERRLRMPKFSGQFNYGFWSAAFLCAAPGCDHLDCPSGGPFALVFVGTDRLWNFTFVSVYSSEADAWWSEPTSVEHPTDYISLRGSALVGDAIYFKFESRRRILEYDLGRQEPAVITLPFARTGTELFTTEDGGLGFAYIQEFNLYMWSREGLNGWMQRRAIDLSGFLSAYALSTSPGLIAFPDGADLIFTSADDAEVFAIHLKLGRVTKVGMRRTISRIVPYMNFYTPALEAALR